MEPYYADDLVTLWLGDCRAVTDWLAADVLVTDPPYGRHWRQGALYINGHDGIAGDDDTVTRDQALAAWGGRPAIVFGDLMLGPPAGTKQVLVYGKPPDAGVRGAMGGFRRDAEAVYLLGPWPTALGGRSSILRTAAQSMIPITAARYKKDRGSGHPHAKAMDVMETLVAACPDGVIADPFTGAGSTLVAARNLGRHAIGVEVDERYCETAARRLSQMVLMPQGVA